MPAPCLSEALVPTCAHLSASHSPSPVTLGADTGVDHVSNRTRVTAVEYVNMCTRLLEELQELEELLTTSSM